MRTSTHVAIYFDDPNGMGYPFSDPDYFSSYRGFAAFAEERNMQVTFVRGNTYLGTMQFRSGWQFKNGELTAINTPFTVDLIYIKCTEEVYTPQPGDTVMNQAEFRRWGNDKWYAYQQLKAYMQPTYQIDADNWEQVAGNITTEKVVLKPVRGSGGDGILIINTTDIGHHVADLDRPYIAQEFTDTSSGIPGITPSYHDLRLLVFNGEVKFSSLRIPKEGSLLANLAQGGKFQSIPVERLPQEILEIARKVDEHFKEYYPRFYSVDFLVSKERPYICEMNDQPGFLKRGSQKDRQLFYQLFFDTLLSGIQ